MTGRLTLVPTTSRPDLDELARQVFAGHWPEFIFHDAGVKLVMDRAERYFARWCTTGRPARDSRVASSRLHTACSTTLGRRLVLAP